MSLTLSKPIKVIVGVLTVWPLLYMFLFLGFVASTFFWIERNQGSSGEHTSAMPIAFLLVFAAHFATILLMFSLMTFYVIYLFKTDRVPQDKKALWAVVLFFGNMLAMPVFFYFYVWPDRNGHGNGS